jgi:hypothetical protein
MEQIFNEYETTFNESQVSEIEATLVKQVDGVLDKLDLGDQKIKITTENKHSRFLTWDGEMLVSAREKLSRFSEPLGGFISFHESRSDFAYIWRKGAFAKDWQPIKTQLSNSLSRVTNVEVESELTKKYLGEQYYSMFHRRRADFLIRKLEAIDRMIRTIDHRLRELYRQASLPQDNSFQLK